MARSASPSVPRDVSTDLPNLAARSPVGPRRARYAAPARRIVLFVVGGLAALVAVVAVVTFAEHRIYAGRVLPGVEIDGVSSSGRHVAFVSDEVARLGERLAGAPVRVRVAGRELEADPSVLDLRVDGPATAHAAFEQGRGGLFSQLVDTARRWVHPEHVPLHVVYDDERLEGMLDGWSAQTGDPFVEGTLHFDGTRVVPIAPRAGTGLLRDDARAALVRMLAGADRPVVTLPVGTIQPQLDVAAVNTAARLARALLRGDVTLVIGGKSVRVTPSQLASAMGTQVRGRTLAVRIDPERLHRALAGALATLEQAPIDATFSINEQNAVGIVPSRDGRMIDMDAVAAAILHGERHISAPLRAAHPRHDTAWAQSLGITHQVSSFTTEYPPGETRVHNIHRGADLLNNTVVEPGQIFSLNRTIGPRTKQRGFVTAPVFAQGEFFDDYGGGVSQLATTVYNAAFFGGYQDITHQPHTIYISRYPAGREATVNYGAIDLQFRDDTPHGILIRAYYSDTSITIAFYGDTDGRTVREENRVQSNPVPVSNDLVRCPASTTVDPNNLCTTLAAGEQEQISNGDPGFDVAFDRVIDQPGKPERREHYTWHYTMLPNQILVGAATAPPASLPTTTTTREPGGTAPTTQRPR